MWSTTELSPFRQTLVALDLETTGLDPRRDAIIEIGAVKFQGRRILDSYTTFVNPYRPVPPFVQRLTGIAAGDVQKAPPFAVAAGELLAFLENRPLVGHNISFDLAFLVSQGLQLSAPFFDTRELASVLLAQGDYSLAGLARSLGVIHSRPHRAFADASATHLVFMALLDKALEWDPPVLEELQRLASIAGWSPRFLFQGLAQEARRSFPGTRTIRPPGGLDLQALAQRIEDSSSRPRGQGIASFVGGKLADVLAPGGALSRVLPAYEHRPQQEEMLRAVDTAFRERQHLLVEAGTGVGKSLAYLLPAAMFALQQGTRVVISTNTINLQEQLVQKDIPVVAKALGLALDHEELGLQFTQLKGRGNYLCLRRWAALRSAEVLREEEARVLSKLLLWLQDTSSGDRTDLRLNGREAAVWERLSAQGAKECPAVKGPCFLRAARERAEAAHLVIVNHALLLSDLARGNTLLPSYDYLVIDEAHNLEEEATRQFGFSVT
ncbi:MAG: DEAD/DEAH box helicase family protein, partial [Chloroflexi bacterium]|nr:DEAD/DEAH box helicase family protein [Chloroflexota bacterium]